MSTVVHACVLCIISCCIRTFCFSSVFLLIFSFFSFCHFSPLMANFSTFDQLPNPFAQSVCFGTSGPFTKRSHRWTSQFVIWGASLQLAVGWSKQLCFGHISIRFDLFFCWTKVYISERFYLPGHLVKLLHSVHRLVSPALHPRVFINWNFSSDSVCFGLVGTCLLNNQNNQLQVQCSFRPIESICIFSWLNIKAEKKSIKKSHSHR